MIILFGLQQALELWYKSKVVVTMPVFKTKRKVQMFGSSLALTIPAMFVKAHELEKGHEIKVFYDFNGVLIASTECSTEELTKRLLDMLNSLGNILAKERVKKRER